MGNKILVTGASGFLGARIVRKLVDRGEHVKAMVRAGSNRRGLAGLPAEQVEVVDADVSIGHTIFRSLAGCDRLIHTAAINNFWAPNPQDIVDTAELGTREVLKAAKQRGIGKVVCTGSVITLGVTSAPEEMTEAHEFNLPDPDPYALGKRKADEVSREFMSDLDLVIAMPSALTGPGDVRPTPMGQMVLEYLGWDVPFIDFPVTTGGVSIADVDDVAEGHVACLEKGKPGESYILGGENLTHEQILSLLSEITGLPGPGAPQGPGLVGLGATLMELGAKITGKAPPITRKAVDNYVGNYSWVSSAKAQKALGYSSRPARKALARAVAWFLENGYIKGAKAKRIRVDLRAPA